MWVNRGAQAWTVEGHTLPRYGFYLRAGKVEAAIELTRRSKGRVVALPRAPLRERSPDRKRWQGSRPASCRDVLPSGEARTLHFSRRPHLFLKLQVHDRHVIFSVPAAIGKAFALGVLHQDGGSFREPVHPAGERPPFE